ncbi:MAG TPA: ester cyclase [Actinomycetota bacterium]|nr:ester cyclase [Actinomycetota bacterium]
MRPAPLRAGQAQAGLGERGLHGLTPETYDIPTFGDEGQVNGAEAVRELWQGLIAGFPDLRIEPGRHLHTDDAVFVEVTLSGTHQGEWIGIPATGRRGSVRIACLYEFEEDRLVCERVWFDLATILRQLGVLPS